MKNHKGKISITLGLLLIAAALLLTAYNLYDGYRAGQAASQALYRLKERIPERAQSEPVRMPGEGPASPAEIELPDYVLNPEMEMPTEEIDGVDYIGTVCIPALELELPVISECTRPNLKIAPCRYAGSAYLDNLVIGAHNYRAYFGPLKNLSQGDEVIFTDMDGNVFCYEVIAMEVLGPTAIEELVFGGYDLTLFTCTVDRASRVAVRCDRVQEAP